MSHRIVSHRTQESLKVKPMKATEVHTQTISSNTYLLTKEKCFKWDQREVWTLLRWLCPQRIAYCMLWHSASVNLSCWHIHRESPGGSMRRDQEEDRPTCCSLLQITVHQNSAAVAAADRGRTRQPQPRQLQRHTAVRSDQ